MKYLEIGKITKTHGIRGEVKVQIITDDLSRFTPGNFIYVGEEKEKIEINNFRIHKHSGLLSFNGNRDINLILGYVGKMLYINKDEIEKPIIGYYYDDLIGCKVIENGEVVCSVYNILEVPQGIILMVKREDNSEERLIPFVEAFIKNVDIDKKEITVNLIEGLL